MSIERIEGFPVLYRQQFVSVQYGGNPTEGLWNVTLAGPLLIIQSQERQEIFDLRKRPRTLDKKIRRIYGQRGFEFSVSYTMQEVIAEVEHVCRLGLAEELKRTVPASAWPIGRIIRRLPVNHRLEEAIAPFVLMLAATVVVYIAADGDLTFGVLITGAAIGMAFWLFLRMMILYEISTDLRQNTDRFKDAGLQRLNYYRVTPRKLRKGQKLPVPIDPGDPLP